MSVKDNALPLPKSTSTGFLARIGRLIPKKDAVPPDYLNTPELVPPNDSSRHQFIGYALIIGGLGGLLLWAAVAPLGSAITASGTVIVEGKRKSIQHLEGGIVHEILVHDGSEVKAGDVLIRLDGTRSVATLGVAKSDYNADLAVHARLLAERDNKPLVFPDSLVAQQADPTVAESMEGQRRQFIERKLSIENQVQILEQRIKQYQSQIDGLNAQQESNVAQTKIYKEELVGLQDLYDQGYYPRTRILAMQREIARLEGEHGAGLASIAGAEKGVGEAKLQILSVRQKFIEDIVAQLREVQNREADDEQRVKANQDVVDRLDIRSPIDGVVQNLRVATVGGVIGSGGELMQIIPSDEKLIIEAQINPNDINYVALDQKAEIRFPALKSRRDRIWFGKVSWISKDRYVDERNPAISYYQCRIQIIDEQGNNKLGTHILQPGMSASAMIETEDRTAIQYFLQPLRESFTGALHEQ